MIVRSLTAARFGPALVLAAALAAAAPASAAIVTYTLSGLADGALGNTGLTAAPFTWTVRTNNLAPSTLSGFPVLQALSADIRLGGADARFNEPTFVLQNGDEFAFIDEALSNGAGWTSPAFANTGLGTAIAPQPTDFAGAVGALTTDHGVLSLADLTNLTFQATVTPTPPVLYTLTGDFSGTLNGVAFNNDPLSWTLLADTSALAPYYGLPALNVLDGGISLGGFGTVTTTSPFEIAERQDGGVAGFVDTKGTQGVTFQSPLFSTYTLGDPLVGQDLSFLGEVPIQTSGGELDIFGGTNLRLSAASVNAVPEPAIWSLMALGFGGLGGLARRRRTAAAAVG